MVKQNGIYKCEICGNVVSILIAEEPSLVCCNQDMKLMEEKTSDKGAEKHVPVIETTKEGIKVKVGSVPHPMDKDHFISLIQLRKGNNTVIGKRLKPGDKPEAEFCCLVFTKGLKARILCNVHGLWVD